MYPASSLEVLLDYFQILLKMEFVNGTDNHDKIERLENASTDLEKKTRISKLASKLLHALQTMNSTEDSANAESDF